MTPTLTAFESSPDKGRGLARDMRVRWALEETRQPYDVRLVSFAEMKQPAHLAQNPFGQIPTYQERDLVLFESGAILLHLAERHAGLLPDEPDARSRAIVWMFAALNTVEPPIVERSMMTLLERGETCGMRSAWQRSTIACASGWANFPGASAMPTGSTAGSARATC